MDKSEQQIVRECRQYLDLLKYSRQLRYRIIHIANPHHGGYQQRAQSVAMSGHADCEIYLLDRLMIHVEFKTRLGKLRDAQKQWKRELESIGHKYYVVRSLSELKVALLANGVKDCSWKDLSG